MMAMRWMAAGLAAVLVTTGGGVSATAQEPAKYQLAFTVIGPDGRLAPEAELLLSPLTEGGEDPGTITIRNGHATVRVPKAGYLLDSRVSVGGDSYRIIQPWLQVRGPKPIVVDARLAKQVTTTVPRKSARVMDGIEVDYIARLGDAGVADSAHADPGHRLFTAQVGPIPAGMSFQAHISSHWAVPGPKGDFADTPFSYDLSQRIPGFPTGYQRVVREAGLTKVASQHTRTSTRPLLKVVSASAGDLPGAVAEFRFRRSGTVTHYMDRVPWDVELVELGGGDRSTDLFSLDQPAADGRRWNTAPFYPSWRLLGRAERQANQMRFDLMSHSDQDGHPGYSPLDTEAMRLYADGRLLRSSAILKLEAAGLPSKATTYRLEAEYSRPSWSQLSVRGSAVWTFPSQTVVANTDLPLQTVRFRPQTDAANLVRRTPVTVLPFQADSRAGVPAARSAKLQYSGDDGRTWRQAIVIRKRNGTFVAYFPTPKGRYVSLRAQLTGAAGNTVDQTLIHAYQLK
ncbi:hypothetical protein [Kribbella sp. NPDC051718]|uniref:hypothetical protein n=1 Tax=Kribbella sp. NPDC051718 TaxID=3155168 RepID=UPI00344137C4